MKYSIKPTNDSDKENAKQLELIMNHKAATYDDISEVIKERVDNFEFKIPCIINGHEASISETESEIISFDQSINDLIIEQLDNDDSKTNNWIKDLTEFCMAERYITTCTPRGIRIQPIMHAVRPAVIGGLNHNIVIADDIKLAKIKEPELIQFDCWKEQKQPKENHPYGWYRKFDKKRF